MPNKIIFSKLNKIQIKIISQHFLTSYHDGYVIFIKLAEIQILCIFSAYGLGRLSFIGVCQDIYLWRCSWHLQFVKFKVESLQFKYLSISLRMGANQSQYTHVNNFDANQWQHAYQNGDVNVLSHRYNPRQLIEEYPISISNEKQLELAQELYNFRHQDPQLVSANYLNVNRQKQLCSKSYSADLYTEHIPIRLSNIVHVPFPDVLHLYNQCFNGFNRLSRRLGFFKVNQQCVGVNQNHVAKVWHSANFSEIEPHFTANSEQQMVRNIIDLIENNTDPSSMPRQEPSFSNFVYRDNESVGFGQAKQKLEMYANNFNRGVIPDHLVCVQRAGGAMNIRNKWNQTNTPQNHQQYDTQIRRNTYNQPPISSANYGEQNNLARSDVLVSSIPVVNNLASSQTGKFYQSQTFAPTFQRKSRIDIPVNRPVVSPPVFTSAPVYQLTSPPPTQVLYNKIQETPRHNSNYFNQQRSNITFTRPVAVQKPLSNYVGIKKENQTQQSASLFLNRQQRNAYHTTSTPNINNFNTINNAQYQNRANIPIRRSDIIVNKPSYQFLENKVQNPVNYNIVNTRVSQAPVVESKFIQKANANAFLNPVQSVKSLNGFTVPKINQQFQLQPQIQPQPQPQPQPQIIQQTQQQKVAFTQQNQQTNTPSQIIKQVNEVKPVIQVNPSSNNLVQVQNQTAQVQIKSQTNQVAQVQGQKQLSQPANQTQGAVNQAYTQLNQGNEATKSNKNIQINQGSQQNINAAQSNKVSFNQPQSAIQQNQKIDLAPQTSKLVVQAFNFPQPVPQNVSIQFQQNQQQSQQQNYQFIPTPTNQQINISQNQFKSEKKLQQVQQAQQVQQVSPSKISQAQQQQVQVQVQEGSKFVPSIQNKIVSFPPPNQVVAVINNQITRVAQNQVISQNKIGGGSVGQISAQRSAEKPSLVEVYETKNEPLISQSYQTSYRSSNSFKNGQQQPIQYNKLTQLQKADSRYEPNYRSSQNYESNYQNKVSNNNYENGVSDNNYKTNNYSNNNYENGEYYNYQSTHRSHEQDNDYSNYNPTSYNYANEYEEKPDKISAKYMHKIYEPTQRNYTSLNNYESKSEQQSNNLTKNKWNADIDSNANGYSNANANEYKYQFEKYAKNNYESQNRYQNTYAQNKNYDDQSYLTNYKQDATGTGTGAAYDYKFSNQAGYSYPTKVGPTQTYDYTYSSKEQGTYKPSLEVEQENSSSRYRQAQERIAQSPSKSNRVNTILEDLRNPLRSPIESRQNVQDYTSSVDKKRSSREENQTSAYRLQDEYSSSRNYTANQNLQDNEAGTNWQSSKFKPTQYQFQYQNPSSKIKQSDTRQYKDSLNLLNEGKFKNNLGNSYAQSYESQQIKQKNFQFKQNNVDGAAYTFSKNNANSGSGYKFQYDDKEEKLPNKYQFSVSNDNFLTSSKLGGGLKNNQFGSLEKYGGAKDALYSFQSKSQYREYSNGELISGYRVTEKDTNLGGYKKNEDLVSGKIYTQGTQTSNRLNKDNYQLKYSTVQNDEYNVQWDPEILADLQSNVHRN